MPIATSLHPQPEDATSSPTPRRRLIRSGLAFYARMLSYFNADWKLLAALVVLIWMALGLGVLEGAVVSVLFDAVLSSRTPSGFAAHLLMSPILTNARMTQVIALALLWLLTRIFNDTVTLLREMINNRLRYNGTARVRFDLFDHLQTLSPAYHKSSPQGDAIYRLSTDAQGFFGVLDTFVGAANSVLTVLVIGFVMAQFNATITLVCICLAPLLLLANIYFSRTIRRTSAASKSADTDFTTFVQRAIASISLAQLFGRQRTESRRFRQIVDRTIDRGMSMSWQQQLYPWSQRLMYAIGHAFILGYGGYLVWRSQAAISRASTMGEAAIPAPALTVGGVTAMLVYLGQLWEPVRRMAGFTADVQTNVAACARVFYVLDLQPTVADAPDARELAVQSRTLSLRHVTFGYEPTLAPVLRDVTARIEPGEMVAFVGRSGAGKSTLLNLLPRFYDPDSGAIWLDDLDLREIRLASIRGHIALVPQDSPVVAGTIAQNIAFGRRSASMQKIEDAAKLAGADAFIDQLPHGYQTLVTESGQNLSGGQRQRLAIARALLTEAPILVLDEPTSGLDRHHEQLVLQTLQRLRRQRTIILVTHHLESVGSCDRIYVMRAGVIAESGTHEQLLSRRGLYASMLADSPQPTSDEAFFVEQ
jgi:ATP-binding cassette, subfamily B, bacterial